MARELGPDIPALADIFFDTQELAEIKKLGLGFWRPHSKPGHWVDTNPHVVAYYLDVLGGDNPFRPLLERLALGLKEVGEQRSIQTIETLGEILFAPERFTNRFLPLDEAFARVSGFGKGALGRHLDELSHVLLHELGRAPGRFIPHAPPKLSTPHDLALALWGENRIRDHVDLTSKAIHLHHVTAELYDLGFTADSPITKAARGLRAEIVGAVDYQKERPPTSSFELLQAIAPPELRAAGCGFTIAEQIVRAEAMRNALPTLADSLTEHVGKLKDRLDVSREEAHLKQFTLEIDFVAAEKIRRIALDPLRDPAFRQAMAAEPKLGEAINKLEVGGLLFGRIEAGNRIHITDIVPFTHVNVGVSHRGPYISFNTEETQKQIAQLEQPGYQFLGDWHLHPEHCRPLPSTIGDTTIHRGFLGSGFADGRVTVQLIAKTDGSPQGTQIFPYAYLPFKQDREASPTGFSRSFYQCNGTTALIPALIEPKTLTEKPQRFLDGVRLAWWERRNRADR